ncbi:AzlD domain-containing protein [Thalassovita taeanensis]|uniref:Branched-chain amino acid transport protein n=1 Tax=Thalassovita taeanensis TaxID=657014 RepID=A0A1H9AS01_9RHOB|nr:AzlD domain-containing protein [Thalassovita taeanensis]SEP79429.1 Branched-chain amino acid transport protein [Thalassovita taeanensis]
MDGIDKTTLWTVIILLGLGSFGLRFVFTGIIGDRSMPEWVLRHLRYTAVAVLPGLVAPLVVWPAATQGQIDPPRVIAALVTLGVGYFTKNVLAAIGLGACSLYAALYLFG